MSAAERRPPDADDLAGRLAALDPARVEELQRRLARPVVPSAPERPVAFSLFFFSGDGSSTSDDKYRLLLETASFADDHGFAAIWVPERHFVDFGGLFPNPSVVAAAIAARTGRVGIRAGSVVLPLHHVVRVAEEWSVVDNLSAGRVAISCASGWHANDFLLAPAAYADRKDRMFTAIEELRRLWRGDERTFPGPDGDVTVRVLPRPVQADLPIWVTTSGTLQTFERAGAAGTSVLAGLLGHSLATLEEGIRRYRAARHAAGHDPGGGIVTVMLHAFVGDDLDTVREVVRAPMLDYLRTYMRQTDPLRPDGPLGERDKARLAEAAFERYFAGASLLGTVDSGAELVARLARAGVDEVACLVDFGVEPNAVLASLPALDRLRQRFAAEQVVAGG